MDIKSYEVSDELRREVEQVLEAGRAKYAAIGHIVLECPFEGDLEEE